MTRIASAALFLLACASPPSGDAPAPVEVAASPAPPATVVDSVTTDRGTLTLLRDAAGDGLLRHTTPGGLTREVACERLEGAWGLWVDDVDRDGRREVLIALRKRARHDPRVENRLHVHALEQGRCVPVWRGTRLAGRFDDLAVDPGEPGALLAFERVGATRRVARYRWSDFGYALETELWRGDGMPPPPLRERFVHVESLEGTP